jgi:hypothetical protein
MMLLLGDQEPVKQTILKRSSPNRGSSEQDRCEQIKHDAAILKDVIPALRAGADVAVHEAECYEVGRILSRFGKVVGRLSNRARGRDPLAIEDEYDAQYVLRALLAVRYDDIRDEDPVSIAAGASSIVDFRLKNVGIAIEVKLASEKLRDNELGKQLAIDITRYAGDPTVKTLFFLVYDPGRKLLNPAGMVNDLRRDGSGMHVRVYVVQ